MLNKLQDKKILLPAIITVLALGFLGRNMFNKPQALKTENIARVQVAKATYNNSLVKGINTTTSLKAVADVKVKTKVDGHLHKIYFKKGQMFKQGDMLLELQHANQSAQVAAMEAQIEMNKAAAAAAKSQKENAAIEQQRYDTLIAKGYATRQEVDAKRTTSRTASSDYDKALASIDYAEAQLKAAKATLADYMFHAPFDGIVLDDYDMSIGNQITKDTNVMRIADISQIKASIDIPEIHLSRLKEGMHVQIVCDALPNENFSGILEIINGFINTNTHTVQADIIIDNKAVGYKLKPGMFARCLIVEESTAKTLVIPTEAIRSDGSILIVKDNHIQETKINVELTNEKETAISGINEGDIVVIGGGNTLKTGDKVTYKEP